LLLSFKEQPVTLLVVIPGRFFVCAVERLKPWAARRGGRWVGAVRAGRSCAPGCLHAASASACFPPGCFHRDSLLS